MRKIFSFILAALSCIFCFPLKASAVETSAQAAIVINADTGRVIYASNAYARLPMASTTKIMTALILAEENTPDKTIVTTKEMVTVEGSSMGLLEGDTVSYRDLLYGMLLASGNDAANTTAIALSGSIEKFAERMNRKAEELGLENTHFVTPSGLHDDNHYTTAYDLAKLAAFALKNEDFAAAASSTSARLYYGNPPYYRTLTNHNKLLNLYDGAIGVKTGYTKAAGRCLVSAAKRNGITLVAVTLNDKNDWQDHQTLLDYGFENSKTVNVTPEIPETLSVISDENLAVKLKCDSAEIGVSLDDSLTYNVVLPKFVYPPIDVGDTVGYVEVLCGDKCITTLNITADSKINGNSADNNIYKKIFKHFLILLRRI